MKKSKHKNAQKYAQKYAQKNAQKNSQKTFLKIYTNIHTYAYSLETHGIKICIGAEIEFCLFNKSSGTPVDMSLFASNVTLDQNSVFLDDLHG